MSPAILSLFVPILSSFLSYLSRSFRRSFPFPSRSFLRSFLIRPVPFFVPFLFVPFLLADYIRPRVSPDVNACRNI